MRRRANPLRSIFPAAAIAAFITSGIDSPTGAEAPAPPRVKVAGEEAILRARDAAATGSIRLEKEPEEFLGSWTDAKDTITWRIEAAEAGERDAVLTYACAPGSGGAEFEVSCGASKARGKVHETGGAGAFLPVPIGMLSIPKGASEIVVRAISKPEGAAGVMNLRGIALQGGFESLFNGKDLAGWWHGHKGGKGYVVEDGVISCARDGGGNLFTDEEYADFIFRFEFRLERGSNNGLGIRAPRQTPDWRARTGRNYDAAYDGMEIQILDDAGYEGKIQPWQRHGSIYHLFAAKPGHLREAGEWNIEEVHCRGRRVTIALNGAVIVDADLDTVKDPKLLQQHPGVLRSTGHIGFLGHGTRVDFRAIRIKDL